MITTPWDTIDRFLQNGKEIARTKTGKQPPSQFFSRDMSCRKANPIISRAIFMISKFVWSAERNFSLGFYLRAYLNLRVLSFAFLLNLKRGSLRSYWSQAAWICSAILSWLSRIGPAKSDLASFWPSCQVSFASVGETATSARTGEIEWPSSRCDWRSAVGGGVGVGGGGDHIKVTWVTCVEGSVVFAALSAAWQEFNRVFDAMSDIGLRFAWRCSWGGLFASICIGSLFVGEVIQNN